MMCLVQHLADKLTSWFHAEGAHRHVEMTPETQQNLNSKDVAVAEDDICQACLDMDCSSPHVSYGGLL